MLTERIVTLGGAPLLTPQDLLKESGCGYDAPTDPSTKALVEQNIKGEQGAITTYKRILDFVAGKDPITYHLILEILEDEIEHEEDLEAIQTDMSSPAK